MIIAKVMSPVQSLVPALIGFSSTPSMAELATGQCTKPSAQSLAVGSVQLFASRLARPGCSNVFIYYCSPLPSILSGLTIAVKRCPGRRSPRDYGAIGFNGRGSSDCCEVC